MSKKRKIITWISSITAVLLLAVTGIAGYLYWDFNQQLKTNSVDITPTKPEPTKTKAAAEVTEFSGAFTALLLGNDDGNGLTDKYGERDHALNDVNILLHVSEDHTKATAISFPRDMYVSMPECVGEDGTTYPAEEEVKINTALSRGGLKCAVDVFRDLTGQPIEFAAMVQFEGVVQLSNAVGGVPVCVASAINDDHTNLHLEPGQHTLQSDSALAFLRTRYGVGDGSDLGRISNQQLFLSSLMRTLKSSSTLSNPVKVYSIAQAITQNMTLSSNLANVNTLASLAYTMKDIPLDNIVFLQYPTTYGDNGVYPNSESADAMIEAVFTDQQLQITGGTAPGEIGSVKTDQPVEITQPTPSPTQTMGVVPSSTPSSTPVPLPSDVTGQTAGEQTCSNGQ